jgi:hypothetical protein
MTSSNFFKIVFGINVFTKIVNFNGFFVLDDSKFGFYLHINIMIDESDI